MTKALAIVKTEDQQPKRKCERIVLIETPPKGPHDGREVMMTRSTRPSTLTVYQVCNNENGGPFNPVGATMTSNKRKALAELRDMRTRYPEVYLAQAVFTRCPDRRR